MATYPAIESQTMSALNAERILLAEELLEAAERAQSFTAAAGAIIAMRRGEEIIVRTSSGVAPEVGTSFGPDDSIIGQCLRTAKPREFTADLAETVRIPLLSALGVRSVAAVPISSDGAVRAVLAVFSQMPSAFSRTHIAILMTMRDVIAAKLERAPVPLAGAWVEAPAPPAVTLPKEEPVREAPPAAVPPAPKLSQPVVAPPPPTTSASELLKLVEEPPPPPIEPDPGLLAPGEDPGKYRPEPVLSAPIRPVTPMPRRSVAPAVAPKRPPMAPPVFTVDTPLPEVRSYAEAAHSRRSLNFKVLGAIAALILAAAALGVYWSKHETSKAAAAAPPPAVTESQPVAVNPAPVTMTVEAPPLKAAPAPAAAKPAEPARSTAAEKPAPAPEKKQTEKVQAQAIQLAPTAPALKRAPEAPAEAPTLAMTHTAAGLPELLSPKAPAAALAPKHSVVVPATLAESRPPVYPEVARRMGLQGSVKLSVSITPQGTVSDVRVISGDAMLRQPSINAVRQWRYHPATLDGRPVESTAEVVLTFKAQR